MNLCNECGSATRDKNGFCGGCGAPWPQSTVGSKSDHPSRMASLPAEISAVGLRLEGVHPKQVWVAVTLAVLAGPIGLLYCTIRGAIIMLIVSFALNFFFGYASLVLVIPACALWAWRAARELTGITG